MIIVLLPFALYSLIISKYVAILNIFTIAGDVFYGCFIEDESHDHLSIVETNVRGNEEIRILNKNEVSHISVIYQSMENNEKREEVMYR